MSKELDWQKLGFTYTKTDKRFISIYKNGAWDSGALVEDNKLNISESSTALHYGQTCFEGLKAYPTKDGKTFLFRPEMNAERMAHSCQRLVMPVFPTERFIEACIELVKANKEWMPPYGSGATLYLRPYMIGIGDNLGVKPAPEYLFGIFCCPVGPYFKGGIAPIKLCVAEYDRAAPFGTGSVKVGGNYASSLLPHEEAIKNGFNDCIYLDPQTHTKIEEVGAANFFGITQDNVFVTPRSSSILPSITKLSLLEVAEKKLGLKVEQRDVFINNLKEFKEAGACGTAAVISPIGSITFRGEKHVFHSETEVGPVSRKLYDTLLGMQYNEIEPFPGWLVEVK